MENFLETLVQGIVKHPQDVKVEPSKPEDGRGYTYKIKVNSQDLGIVIGKRGKTIRSLRNLAKAKSIKDNIFVNVLIEEG